MVRINRRELTKLEIIRFAAKQFLENGYSNTQVRTLARELNMSPGNLTFHYPTKEDMLAELVHLLGDFQHKMMEEEAKEGYSSVMAICLEFAAMASICEEDEVARDFYLSTYSSPLCLGIIRKNDTARAKEVFRAYCPHWADEDFEEAEILVSGIEYANLITSGVSVSLETRIAGALNSILSTYCVPEEERQKKIDRVLSLDYKKIGRRVLQEFKQYVNETNEYALIQLLTGRLIGAEQLTHTSMEL